MVVDGVEGSLHDGIIGNGPRFSSDSKHVAYFARRGAQGFLVIDGVEGPSFEGIRVPHALFHPNRSIEYLGWRSNTLYRVRHVPTRG